MRVWLWLVYKFTENYCRLRLFSEFIQTQKRYPNSLDKIRILLENYLSNQAKIFLVNLLLAKYLISVAGTLRVTCSEMKNEFSRFIAQFYLIITLEKFLPSNCVVTKQS